MPKNAQKNLLRFEYFEYFQKEDAAQNCQALKEKVQLLFQSAQRLKWQTLKSIREEILQCDQTTRACTCSYFQTLSQLWAPIPNQVIQSILIRVILQSFTVQSDRMQEYKCIAMQCNIAHCTSHCISHCISHCTLHIAMQYAM